MNVLFIGDNSPASTSSQRMAALRRIGCVVKLISIHDIIGSINGNKYISAINYRTGYFFLQRMVYNYISRFIIRGELKNINLVWVDGGEYCSRRTINLLNKQCRTLLYNCDDPTGSRDGKRFATLISAIPEYNLTVTVRNETEIELSKLGARNVMRVWRSYDEVAHAPYANLCDIEDKYQSDIVFVGTWMRNEGRDDFLLKLVESGLNISIWGNRWELSRHWNKLRPYWKGASLSGRDYVAAIQGSKIAIGFVSEGNRDLHTRRTFEIPFIGGLLCAKRTKEHLELFEEGKEAIFWENAEECASICKELLSDSKRRENIRMSGFKKVRHGGYGNEHICKEIIERV